MDFAEVLKNIRNTSDRETVSVTVDGNTFDATFRILPYLEVDRLGMYAVGDNAKFDRNRAAGNNLRWLAATLISPEGGSYGEEEIGTWKAAYINALAAAARKVNGQDTTTEDAAKNSSGGSATGGPST